ncbi:MAG: hypothetical protein JWQ81_926 [Amycolatopsis sp.]|uniref:hypothetical protein n=1 Tax=Amycolatopsis sp. TaxID=37632 RepID=UPI00262C7F56|nr:hypothetical protein [Amycolatopsis sp.]MCU1680187.1 hypothetical protein [Amycolatopsis sp.]
MAVNDKQGAGTRATVGRGRRTPTGLDQLIDCINPHPQLSLPTARPSPDVVGEHVTPAAAPNKPTYLSQPQGLPVARLLEHSPRSEVHYTVTAMDAHGRLADRSPLRILGWLPEARVSLGAIRGVLIIGRRSDGPDTVTRQGHLQLSASIRHACRLQAGARLLVAAYPDRGLLAAYSGSALDAMVQAYHESLRSEAA